MPTSIGFSKLIYVIACIFTQKEYNDNEKNKSFKVCEVLYDGKQVYQVSSLYDSRSPLLLSISD